MRLVARIWPSCGSRSGPTRAKRAKKKRQLAKGVTRSQGRYADSRAESLGWLPPFGAESRAVYFMPSQVDLRNSFRVRDVIERIRIEHDEVGALTRRDCAELVQPQDFGGGARGCHNRFG